ncbi:MAG: ATP-binding protein, partial [Promethearchaeota archaeon]
AQNPLEKVSNSIAPQIYGMDMIKKGITLQMVKGNYYNYYDNNKIEKRGDIHILLLGEPGLGKSRINESVAKIVPRCRSASGTKSSGVGLTASLTRDERDGKWVVEAGTLPLAHGSMVVIEEMEKMSQDDIDALQEPMSKGRVDIDKVASAKLPSQTSILASSNPKGGKFDPEKLIANQVKFEYQVLNRFDLIYILKDKPDKDKDREAVEHIYSGDMTEPVDIDILKKYIYYCRKLEPRKSEEYKELIKDFYIKLRQQSKTQELEGMPFNHRNREAIDRLAEAHAKLRMSDKVEKEDFEAVKEIYMYYMKSLGMYEDGKIDISKKAEKIATSKRGKIRKVKTIIEILENRLGKLIPIDELKDKCGEASIDYNDVDIAIEQLSEAGEIFKPKKGFVQKIE